MTFALKNFRSLRWRPAFLDDPSYRWQMRRAAPREVFVLLSLLALGVTVSSREDTLSAALWLLTFLLLACVSRIPASCFAFCRDRASGVLEAELLARGVSSRLVLGRLLAVLLRWCIVVTAVFGICIAWPPSSPGFHLIRFAVPVRVFLACLWMDALAAGAVCALVGLTLSARCRSALAAAAVAGTLAAVPVVLAVVAVAGFFHVAILLPETPVTLGIGAHPAFWSLALAAAWALWVLLQREVDPAAPRLSILPGLRAPGRIAVPLSFAALAVAAAAAGACFLVPVARELRSELRLVQCADALEQADRLASSGRTAQALVLLDAEIARGVRGKAAVACWSQKASCHRALRQYTNAVAAYRALARLPGEEAFCRAMMGDIWAEAGDLCRALSEYQEAARLDLACLQAMRAADEKERARRGLPYLARRMLRVGAAREAGELLRRIPDDGGEFLREVRITVRERLDLAPRLGIRMCCGRVNGVIAGMGAAKAGVPRDAILESIAGHPFADDLGAMRLLKKYRPGRAVPVVLRSHRRRWQLSIPLSSPRYPWKGEI